MEWTKTKQLSTAQKSTDLGSWSPLAPWVNAADRGDQLSRTKWGAAKSYIVIGYVEKCVELIASGITSLPYSIKRFEQGITGTDDRWTGTEIARSDDPIPQHPLFQLFHAYEDHQHMSLLFRVAASLTLFDELYIELVRKFDNAPVSQCNPLIALDWLNPLGMSINAANGKINQYFYSPFDTAKPATFEPFEIAYKHGYNPEDDLRGYPDVLAVLESLEIDFAIQTSVVSHFRNGIGASAVVSPKDGFSNLNAAREGMDDAKKRSRGPENYGGFIYWPKGIDVTRIDYPDYAAITAYSRETGDRILDQFGVSREILGNSDKSGWYNASEDTYRFYVGNIIPRADDIVKFFNRRIIPLLPHEYRMDRLVVDRSEFDRVSENDQKLADIAGTNLNNTIITINEARLRQKLEPFEPKRGDLLIVQPGTVFISPDDLKSGFVAGGTPEEAAVVEQTSDVEGDEQEENSSRLERYLERESAGATPRTPEQKSNLICVKAVMARSQANIDSWEWSIEKAHKELDAWYTFVKRRGANGLKSLSKFEPNYTRGDIADVVLESFKGYNKAQSGLTVKAIFGMVKDWVAVKAIQATRIDFEDDFEDALQTHIDGKATPRQASIRFRSIIRKADNKAFRDGLTDGGALGEEPTDAEQVEINQFISEQSQFVTSLLGMVKSEKLASSQGKGKQWYNKSVQPMYDAGLASAGGNKMVEWVLGKTEVHCRSCLGYNGQRHRFKTFLLIGAMPQSDTLVCNGYNCDCGLVAVIAKARGKLKLIIKSIQELMKAKPFSESDVSRDEGGQFAPSGGGGGGGAADDKPKEPEKPDMLPKEKPKLSEGESGIGGTRKLGNTTFSNVDPSNGDFADGGEKFLDDTAAQGKRGTEKVETVRDYTGGGFSPVNKSLRGQRKSDKFVKKDIKQIDSLMDANPLSQDVRAYRRDTGGGLPNGGDMSDNEFLNLSGTNFHDGGYTSTTVSPGIIEAGKGDYVYEFLVPKGSKGLYIDSVSRFGDEDELLLGRGGNYHILETSIGSSGQRNIVAEVLGSG